MADEETDVTPVEVETEEETNVSEEKLPTTEERLQNCYEELRAIRAEIAELRAHTHADLAYATHEHEQYASSDHAHDIPHADADQTEPASTSEPPSTGAGHDASPQPSHPWFRSIKR